MARTGSRLEFELRRVDRDAPGLARDERQGNRRQSPRRSGLCQRLDRRRNAEARFLVTRRTRDGQLPAQPHAAQVQPHTVERRMARQRVGPVGAGCRHERRHRASIGCGAYSGPHDIASGAAEHRAALAKLAVLWNPTNSSHRPALQATEVAARSLSLQVRPLEVRSPAELDSIFAAIVRERADGVLFIADPIFFIHLKRMVDLVASNRLPAICNFIEFPKLGGLMGYAPSLPDEFRHAASHIDKIIKGAKPADLPVEQPTRFQLAINLKTAKALGLDVPPTLVAIADEVIE
jgi:hypothetical protein